MPQTLLRCAVRAMCYPHRPIPPAPLRSTPLTSTLTCSWFATISTPLFPKISPLPSHEFARETIAAEDILHDLGAFSMMASDSQAMGRVGEVVLRTWQTAHKMKVQRGPLPDETGENDNVRAKTLYCQIRNKPCNHARHQ